MSASFDPETSQFPHALHATTNTNAAIAPNDYLQPTISARIAVFYLLFIPWLVIYEWIVYRGPRAGSFQTYLPGEIHWPILQWMEILYVSPYLLVTLAPLIATTNRVLRQFVVAGFLSIVLVNAIFLTVPAIARPRPFHPAGILGHMMLTDRALDLNNGTAAFPSFHVIWAFLGAIVFAQRWPRLRIISFAWATAVAASCIFTGMHSLCDVIAGFGMFLIVHHCAGAILNLQPAAPPADTVLSSHSSTAARSTPSPLAAPAASSISPPTSS